MERSGAMPFRRRKSIVVAHSEKKKHRNETFGILQMRMHWMKYSENLHQMCWNINHSLRKTRRNTFHYVWRICNGIVISSPFCSICTQIHLRTSRGRPFLPRCQNSNANTNQCIPYRSGFCVLCVFYSNNECICETHVRLSCFRSMHTHNLQYRRTSVCNGLSHLS